VSPRALPNINWVRALVCPAVVFIAMGMDRGYQTDFWHHLARGREIAQTGRVTNLTPLTFAAPDADAHALDANWLTQVAYYKLFQLGGLALVQTVNGLILSGAAGLLFWICRRQAKSHAIAAFVSVGAFAGLWQTLLIRPQSASLLLFLGLYAILTESEHRPRLLALVPLIFALWANVHGGFPVGFVLIGAFIIGTTIEHRRVPILLAVTAGACLFASLINPYGWRVYEYVFTLSSRAAGRQVEEWLPPSLNLWVGRALLVSVIAFITMLVTVQRRPRARDVVVAFCFLPLACASTRMVPWWLLTAAPVFAATIAVNRTADDAPAPRPSFAAGAMLAVIVLCAVLSVPSLQRFNPVFASLRPATRAEHDIEKTLANLSPGSRVFTRLEWGEYVDWESAPDAKAFVDGRIELYPDDVWREYHAVTSAQLNWERVLDAQRVDYLLLDSTFHGDLLPRVECSGKWEQISSSGPAQLYRRRSETLTASVDVSPAQ
jgi:hypothetical protein